MALAVFAIGGFVGIGAFGVAKIVAVGVGPESGINDFDVVLGDEFGVIIVLFVEAFF